ncbi:acyltransferase [Leptolyngbya sp. FACHB-16]|uniref:acyltransferase family protein n=1 Tax=unclassified Leptolyngbya TaxID=2650499 RepID=UPI00168845C1|nr:acyltransferase [Leptolyngbya sp. FACHB-16]MBD2156186.1 acyltransferase [Leptolyngbya sp. FACHB-16]
MSINQQIDLEKQPEGKIRHRFTLIDGLRGIAALAVAGYHFYLGSPLHEPLSKVIPTPFGLLLSYGWLGVEVFFVISGFVIAYSLRESEITLAFLGNFALRRILRLSPPYWITIALALFIKGVSNLVLSDRIAALPSSSVVLAHIVYLQNVLNMDNIVPVFWTLCLEIQFYFVFIILISIDQRLSKKKSNLSSFFSPLLFFVLFLGSLILRTTSQESIQSFLYPYWYMFFMGSLTWWVLEKKIHTTFYWLYIAIMIVPLVHHWDIRILATLITGLSIYLASLGNQLDHWLDNRWQQYLGKISYSFYLVHIPIGMSLINVGYRLSGGSSVMALIWFFLAFLVSIAAAHFIYQFVEKPSLKLSQKFKFDTSSI